MMKSNLAIAVRSILDRHDPVFEEPAAKWEQGIMQGNGLIGTVLWGGGDEPVKISVDQADIWETRRWTPDKDHNWIAYKELLKAGKGAQTDGFVRPGKIPHPTRIPFGRMEFTPLGKTIKCSSRLYLARAEAVMEILTDLGSIILTLTVAAEAQVFLVDIKYTGSERMTLVWKHHTEKGSYTEDDRKKSTRYSPGTGNYTKYTYEQLAADWGYPAPVKNKIDNIETWRQQIPESGSYASAMTRVGFSPDHELYVTSIVCDRASDTCEDEAEKNVNHYIARQKETLVDHLAYWEDFWSRSFLSIPDSRIEAYYYLETFLLGCSTHPGGLHMTICGPWTDDDTFMPICDNDYHWNLEQQMQLWSVYVSNRLDFGTPMFDLLEENIENLKVAAQLHFNVPGAFLTHCTTRFCEPTYMNIDNFELNGLPWVCFHYWQHWRYSMDVDFLEKRAYPMMKLAILPILEELEEGKDGFFHLPWTSSPEYHSSQETIRWYLHTAPDWSNRFGEDATIDLALTKWLLGALAEASCILGVDAKEREQWTTIKNKIAPYPVDEIGGLAVRKGLSLTSSHRHQSHLFPFYPLHEYTVENQGELYQKSLDNLGIVGRGEWVGWTFPWISLLCAYGNRAAAARNILSDMVERYVTESGTHYQGPQGGCDISLYGNKDGVFGLTIEAQLGFLAAVQELLIQSNGGVVRIFENAPPLWSDAVFSGLRAEGAFVIDAVRKDYKTVFARVTSEAGGRLKLAASFPEDEPEFKVNGRTEKYRREGGHYIYDTKPGDILVFGKECELSTIPIREEHFFGVKHIKRF